LNPGIIDTIDAHVELFEQFCWAIQDGELNAGIIFSPDADDVELRNFSKKYHEDRNVGPAMGTTPVAGTTTMTPGARRGGDFQGSLAILTQALTRTVEEQGSSASILEKMHQHSVDKVAEKKDKSIDWHPNLTKMVRFAASPDGINPAPGIPPSYKKIINASLISQAEIEMIAQMRESGNEEIEWDLALVNAIRNGLFEYTKMDTPSNVSIFSLRVKDPTTLNEQHARGMELHILESGKDSNKDIIEKIQASKKKIKLPTTIEDLITIVKGFGGIAAILFGAFSILPTNLRQFARELNINKLLVKGKIAIDKTLTAQILYTIDNRTQLFLSYLRRANDIEEVSTSITDFTQMANDLMLGQLKVVLPATFTHPTIAKDDKNEQDGPPKGGGKRRKKGGPTPLGEIEGGGRLDNTVISHPSFV